MDLTLKMIEHIMEIEEKQLVKYSSEIKKLKGGSVRIRKRGQKFFYTEVVDGVEKGINTDKEKIKTLLRKRYLIREIRYKDAKLKVLKNARNALKGIREPKYSNIGIESMYSAASLAWMRAAFEKNERYPEALQYESQFGTVVRSKSELLIANTLEQMGIPYRYEQKIVIDGTVLHPDFILLKLDGSKIIWEHFGRMDDESYASNAMHKIELYQQAGFKQHTNFICTTEEDIKKKGCLEELITRFVYS